MPSLPVGVEPAADGTYEFVVWAPNHNSVKLILFALGTGEEGRRVEMRSNDFGYFQAKVANVSSGARYAYELGSTSAPLPDPASYFQPDGVHGSSQLVNLGEFIWTDGNWKAPALEYSVFYELHVGTFTPEGTLDAAAKELNKLADLGVTTIELMPVAQFPGTRNWGYDGVYPYAVQNSYGGPKALQRFVDGAHNRGLAVALDVVYNHLGPEGNYLGHFAPYFTHKYTTPWGQAINFDGPQSEPVRRFFIDNAIHWIEHFHIDVLRLDAIHGILDFGATHFLAELQSHISETAKRLRRDATLVAESDLNDARVLLNGQRGGYGIRAQWSDDFHHSLHTLLTHETQGYYGDFGRVQDLSVVLHDGWFYQGQYSEFRKRHHGNSPRGISRSSFVACAQNHDQVGNRALGERLSQLVSFEAQKLAAGLVLLSPFVPLLFMGEEYAETSPFLYFIDHGDPDLVEAVRKGRRAEFAEFGWGQAVPDPQDPSTFEASKLRGSKTEHQQSLHKLYQELMAFRRENELGVEAEWQITADEGKQCLQASRNRNDTTLAMVFNFSKEFVEVLPVAMTEYARDLTDQETWRVEYCSSDALWLGPGIIGSGIIGFGEDAKRPRKVKLAPLSFVVLQKGKVQPRTSKEASTDPLQQSEE
jgi:maltooligosyltrehalose trehalohydrolase